MAYRRTDRVAARLAATRERIIDATVGVVASDGWAAVTVSAVADAAGVATGTVYRHVANKDELCALAFRRAAGRELAHVAEAVTHHGSAFERVAAGLHVFGERALRGRRLAYALLAEPASAIVEAERLTYRGGYRAVFRDALVYGQAAGELAPHDAELVAAVLIGGMGEALSGALVPGHAEPDPETATAVVAQTVACCLRALPLLHQEVPDARHP